MTALMLIIFLLLLLIGIPIFIALLIASFAGILYLGDLSLLRVIPQQFFGGMDVFTLLAIPLFILTGNLMNRSALTDKLLDFCRVLVGHLRGGLGHVNVVASIVFAGINGSAAADASAIGSVLIPAMAKEGYDRSYAAGITAGSSLIGPIIPPSIFMVLYGAMTNQPIGALFAGGVIPGLLLGVAFMIMNHYYSVKYDYPVSNRRASLKEITETTRHSIVALIAPIIIIGGILLGIVTPTEAGALAVFYVAIVGFFITKKLTVKLFIEAILETVRSTSVIFVIMGGAAALCWLLKWEQVPQKVAMMLVNVSNNPTVLMLILSAIIFVIGMFMEEVAALILLTPVVAPVAMMAGINPIHFGIVMTLNITIALITPPMGACVHIVSAVGKVPLEKMFKDIWPFVGVSMIVLLLVILFPPLVTFLPGILNL
ncbi:MAG: TRAP transporter large permease [Bacillota bacterium]|jgi:tripartite ATP-independent transporter DctM subunit|nr:TRAP transporter large permease [Bacillota bacterium]HOB88610.1 TRAP transporter large permease [Bacillota bacterium]HOJ58325.1 TRAP transporter large permease [Bacillota bacterium]HOL02643.1 TRAP transporter large permease [Bacillota bacterium]HPO81070.1 TRAP transporter large permease [Bacillota bacterium]